MKRHYSDSTEYSSNMIIERPLYSPTTNRRYNDVYDTSHTNNQHKRSYTDTTYDRQYHNTSNNSSNDQYITFYLFYYIGHYSASNGHEFIEYRIDSNILNYNNHSLYHRNKSTITKTVKLHELCIDQLYNLINQYNIRTIDSNDFPQTTNQYQSRQLLRIILDNHKYELSSIDIDSVYTLEQYNNNELNQYYWFVQNMKQLLTSIVTLHFKEQPI